MTDEHNEKPFTATSWASFLAWKEKRLEAARKKLKKAFAESEAAGQALIEARRALSRAQNAGDASAVKYATEQHDDAQTRNGNAQRAVLDALQKFRSAEERYTLDEYLRFKQETALGGRS